MQGCTFLFLQGTGRRVPLGVQLSCQNAVLCQCWSTGCQASHHPCHMPLTNVSIRTDSLSLFVSLSRPLALPLSPSLSLSLQLGVIVSTVSTLPRCQAVHELGTKALPQSAMICIWPATNVMALQQLLTRRFNASRGTAMPSCPVRCTQDTGHAWRVLLPRCGPADAGTVQCKASCSAPTFQGGFVAGLGKRLSQCLRAEGGARPDCADGVGVPCHDGIALCIIPI